MIRFLKDENYTEIDISKIGVYKPIKPDLKSRIKFQWRNYTAKSRWEIIGLLKENKKYYWTR